MANEIAHNFRSGETLYACRFQLDGDVFITSGASDEVWGTGGNDASDYAVTMTESGDSGHYVGDFDASNNIGAAFYRVAVYHQADASPADPDVAVAEGVGEWDGDAFEVCAKKQDVLDAHVITDGEIGVVSDDLRRVKNVYGPDTLTSQGVFPEVQPL